jgi:hypothetical protein
MKSSMHNLQSQYDAMCQKVGVLGSLYSNLTESFILIENQAKQFPKLIKKTVTAPCHLLLPGGLLLTLIPSLDTELPKNAPDCHD